MAFLTPKKSSPAPQMVPGKPSNPIHQKQPSSTHRWMALYESGIVGSRTL
jgi:hypothetical protein